MKKSTIIFTLSILVLVIILSIFGIKAYKHYKYYKKIEYKDYVYKIRYDYYAESYIYLLSNKEIKVVKVIPVLEKVSTGDIATTGLSVEVGKHYEEKTIKLSNDKKQKAIKVFKELSKKTGKKSFNANDVELTENEENTLISIVLSSY